MKLSSALLRTAVGAAVILALIAGSPAFGADVIHKGVDLWMTVSGFARTSFADQPIPAGFFCAGSQPFTGRIVLKGDPLAVAPANSLGAIDTVVRRLDDAAFNDKGEATTRIQLMALSMVSAQPIDTSCGAYDVAVSLAGKQPTTTMRIFKTDALGGTYSAPLSLNVKAVFTPVHGDPSARRELTRRIELGPGSRSVWTYLNLPRYEPGVRIDTDGDGKPDTVLPASSNFLAGVSPAVLKTAPPLPSLASTTTPLSCPAGQCPYNSCHCTPLDAVPPPTWNQSAAGCDHLHCVLVCAPNPHPGFPCPVPVQQPSGQ